VRAAAARSFGTSSTMVAGGTSAALRAATTADVTTALGLVAGRIGAGVPPRTDDCQPSDPDYPTCAPTSPVPQSTSGCAPGDPDYPTCAPDKAVVCQPGYWAYPSCLESGDAGAGRSAKVLGAGSTDTAAERPGLTSLLTDDLPGTGMPAGLGLLTVLGLALTIAGLATTRSRRRA
jgi:hypothetical protein